MDRKSVLEVGKVLYHSGLPFRVRLFNILASLGFIISLCNGVLSYWNNGDRKLLLINTGIALLSLSLLFYAYHSKKYQRCYFITVSYTHLVECCYARHELKDDYFAVILDWKMPDMDGIETARQIRKRIGKEITIIVLTSYEFSEIEEEAKAAGIDAFIAKPLFRSRLTATLRQFTSGRKEKTARNYLEELSESD